MSAGYTSVMLNSYAILLFDCQSTGASPLSSSLLEIACNEDSWVLRQQETVPGKILRLIGISREEIESGYSSEVVFECIKQKIDSITRTHHGKIFAVAHFSRFEKAYLDQLWQANGQVEFPLPIICTHRLAKLLHPRLPNYGLRALAGWFGMPLEEGKRAANHVCATRQIWTALCRDLEGLGITSLEQVVDFLNQKPERNQGKKDFLIPREKRLALPADPGVYRYIDRSGRILYVGKATSLKSRVNSYFTGGCRGDHRKLEMLAQAVDFDFTVTDAPIFAGLLEYDEIRRLKPPYNIAFKGRGRDPLRDLEFLTGAMASFNPEKYPSTLKECFYDLNDMQLLREGVSLFRRQFGIPVERELTARDLLNFGVPLVKQWVQEEKDRRRCLTDLSEEHGEEQNEDNSDEDEEILVWTPDLVASACVRIIRRATRHHIRSKWLRRIAGASIHLTVKSRAKGQRKFKSHEFTLSPTMVEGELDLRRVKVLLHELRRAESNGGSWQVTSPWSMNVPFWI